MMTKSVAPSTAILVGLTALVLGLLLPFASLPPFSFGYWEKAEPIVVGLHFVAGLGGVALALGAVRNPGMVIGCVFHPLVLAPAALSAWSVLAATAVELPLLSLTGSPQSGNGAIWYLDLALLIAAARMVLLDEGRETLLRRAACLVVAGAAIIKLWDWIAYGSGPGHLLVWIPSYYAWLGLALPALVIGRERSKPWLVAAFAAVAAVLIAARSDGAWLALAAGGAVAASHHVLRNVRASRRLAAAAVIGAAVLPGVLLAAAPILRQAPSLADRFSLLLMIKAETALWSPLQWLIGLGWGRTQDVFHAHLPSSGMRIWDDSWIFMTSDYFHSHNEFLEALLAAGIPGLLSALAFPALLPLTAPPARRASAAYLGVALAAMGAVWFQLALSLPLIAVAAAAQTSSPVAAGTDRSDSKTARRGAVAALLLALAACCPLVLSALLLKHGCEADKDRAALLSGLAPKEPFLVDVGGEDLTAAVIIRDAFREFETIAPAERSSRQAAAAAMIRLLDQRIPLTKSVLLPVTGLSLMAQIRTIGSLEWLAPAMPYLGTAWAIWLDRALILAPERSDLAIPMLSEMSRQGRFDLMEPWVRRLLDRDRHDPVGLYFRGFLLVVSTDPASRQSGLSILRDSVAAGIERLMPLDPRLKSLLSNP